MKKSIIVLGVIILLIGLLYFVLKEKSFSDSTLRVGTSADNRPYEFFQDGEIVGFDIDLIQAIGRALDKEIEIVDIDFNGLIPALQAGRLNVVIAAMTPTPERAKFVDFTVPYLTSQSAIVSLKERPIYRLEDLKGKTVAAQLGSHHETNTRSLEISGLVVKAYNRVPDMIQELKSGLNRDKGRIDGIVIGVPEAEEIVAMDPSFIYEKLPVNDNCSIVLQKGSKLTSEMNEIIESLKRDQVIDQLQQKWGINTISIL